jgi:hypothetical protein
MRNFEGKLCPKCGIGILRGNIKNAKKWLIRCSNPKCKQVFQVRAKIVSDDDFANDGELPVVPPGTFMGFAKRMVAYIQLLGNENLVSHFILVNLSLPDGRRIENTPMFKLIWLAKDPAEIPAEEQLKQKIEPVRTLAWAAYDPLWFQYGMIEEHTKLANDEEIKIIQSLEGVSL